LVVAAAACGNRGGLQPSDAGADNGLDVAGAELAADRTDAQRSADAGATGPDADAAREASADLVDASDAADAGADRGPTLTQFNGPGGSYVLAVAASVDIRDDCSGIPASLFSRRYSCIHAEANQLQGSAQVCLPNPGSDTESGIARCNPDVTCEAPDTMFGGKCCAHLRALNGRPVLCADTTRLGDFAVGDLTDTDSDFVPDIDDNCPTVPNTQQEDVCHGDGGDGPGLD
jgi:hypothetical protein